MAPAAVGLGALVLVGIVLERSTPASVADFAAAVLNKLHGQQLIALPGVRQTRTFFVMKEVKDGARLHF